MKFKPPKNNVRSGPEAKGASRLCMYMRGEGWYLKKLHGGYYQSGMPDYVAWHPLHGQRWIETKAPGGKISKVQFDMFKLMERYGQEVFILEDEKHYYRLFEKKGNWFEYFRY